jgi:hypothetical protein
LTSQGDAIGQIVNDFNAFCVFENGDVFEKKVQFGPGVSLIVKINTFIVDCLNWRSLSL